MTGVPIPKVVARFNLHVTNRLAGPVAGWLPPFALVLHRGRISDRAYRTPVWAFRTPDGYVIALTYGAGSEWVRNVLKAGGCTLRVRGRRFTCTRPLVVSGPGDAAGLVPWMVRGPLRVLKVTEFLRLSRMT
jgi:deazaflavin-dependent oxidoreductase (nitroreductase family)